MDNDKIILEAYRLIRQHSRNIVDPMTNEQLGCYVRGIVDLQTELWNSSNNSSEDKK